MLFLGFCIATALARTCLQRAANHRHILQQNCEPHAHKWARDEPRRRNAVKRGVQRRSSDRISQRTALVQATESGMIHNNTIKEKSPEGNSHEEHGSGMHGQAPRSAGSLEGRKLTLFAAGQRSFFRSCTSIPPETCRCAALISPMNIRTTNTTQTIAESRTGREVRREVPPRRLTALPDAETAP